MNRCWYLINEDLYFIQNFLLCGQCHCFLVPTCHWGPHVTSSCHLGSSGCAVSETFLVIGNLESCEHWAVFCGTPPDGPCLMFSHDAAGGCVWIVWTCRPPGRSLWCWLWSPGWGVLSGSPVEDDSVLSTVTTGRGGLLREAELLYQLYGFFCRDTGLFSPFAFLFSDLLKSAWTRGPLFCT